jgi:hypothetical protein
MQELATRITLPTVITLFSQRWKNDFTIYKSV